MHLTVLSVIIRQFYLLVKQMALMIIIEKIDAQRSRYPMLYFAILTGMLSARLSEMQDCHTHSSSLFLQFRLEGFIPFLRYSIHSRFFRKNGQTACIFHENSI